MFVCWFVPAIAERSCGPVVQIYLNGLECTVGTRSRTGSRSISTYGLLPDTFPVRNSPVEKILFSNLSALDVYQYSRIACLVVFRSIGWINRLNVSMTADNQRGENAQLQL